MFLFCLVFALFCARLFICALWSPAGKGLTSWLSFVVSSVSLSLSHWYPGSGVVLDCIDSWSLHHYLLWSCAMNIGNKVYRYSWNAIQSSIPCISNQCQHQLNNIPYTSPRTELFHSECLSELPIRMHDTYHLSTVNVSKRRRMIDHTIIIV